MNELDRRIIDMYNKGYSIKSIVDYVFGYSKRNYPKNYQYTNCKIDDYKDYARCDCIIYVSKVLINYNGRKNKKNSK